jgi:GNAT superfamily N-acetyltransferase
VLGRLFAEADGARLPIRLGVLKQSPAIRLYERHGFIRTHAGEWDVYYERAAPGGFVVTDAPDDLLKKTIDDGLTAYNIEQAGYADGRPLAIVIRDPAGGRPVGGMLGRTSLGVLFVDLVFLPPHMRGKDLGARMLAAMESEGKRRGCKTGVLFTLSFQAPGFYAKYGWREFGRIPCEPPGTSRVFMTKTL